MVQAEPVAAVVEIGGEFRCEPVRLGKPLPDLARLRNDGDAVPAQDPADLRVGVQGGDQLDLRRTAPWWWASDADSQPVIVRRAQYDLP